MDDLFQTLETQIRTLIERFEQLEYEKEALATKNKIVVSQIENMISRLKSIESPS